MYNELKSLFCIVHIYMHNVLAGHLEKNAKAVKGLNFSRFLQNNSAPKKTK